MGGREAVGQGTVIALESGYLQGRGRWNGRDQILGHELGTQARVLSPHSLRDEIRNEAKQMVMEYEEEESWDAP